MLWDLQGSPSNPAAPCIQPITDGCVHVCLWGGVESCQAGGEAGQEVMLSPEASPMGRDGRLGADPSQERFPESV